MKVQLHLALLFLLIFGAGISAAPAGTAAVKTEAFDRDPNWEGFNNRVSPKRLPTMIQAGDLTMVKGCGYFVPQS